MLWSFAYMYICIYIYTLIGRSISLASKISRAIAAKGNRNNMDFFPKVGKYVQDLSWQTIGHGVSLGIVWLDSVVNISLERGVGRLR